MPNDFEPVFEALKAIMVSCSANMKVLHDEPGKYYLLSNFLTKSKQPIWFGGVEIKKNYVSYHLFAVYCSPALHAKISPALLKRMQGKACFNFKTIDEPLFAELAELTHASIDAFKNMPPI